MNLPDKLNLKDEAIHLVNVPADLSIAIKVDPLSPNVLLFARSMADLDDLGGPLYAAAAADEIAWLAYPKDGKLGTDLNRDIIASHVQGSGVRPVRQIAINDTWSALRFRPA